MDVLKIFRKNNIRPTISDIVIKNYYDKYPASKIICKAPFSSIYFHPDGEVGACCLNKCEYYYGIYNNDSVHEIINSASRKKHQNYLKSNNFSLGCHICEHSLVAGNYSGLLANIYQKFTTNKNLERIDFELSYHCNFDCVMCVRDKSNKKSPIYNESFFNEIKPLLKKIKFANFLGGEPFLIPIYYQIWEYLIKHNPKCMITLQTNGSIYNAKIETLLQNINFHIGVSLDSMDPVNFENIRKNSSFVTVLKNIEIFGKAMKAKGSNLQLSACPMRINYQDIPEIVNFANRNDYLLFFNQVFTPYYLTIKDLKSDEFHEIIKLYKTFSLELLENTYCEKENMNSFKDLIKLIELWYNNALSREKNSRFLSHEDIIKIILSTDNKINKENTIILKNVFSELPKKILCSLEQIKELRNFNYSIFFRTDLDKKVIHKALLSEATLFFNLDENLQNE
jgi:MoaA/NifB/PqqE/SkfB family radical SAM enzyme